MKLTSIPFLGLHQFDVRGTVDLSGGNKLIVPIENDTTRSSNPEEGEVIFNTDAQTLQVGLSNGNWKGL